MVGHYTPSLQVITVTIEFKQGILDYFRAMRISQMALSMSGIQQFMYMFQLFNREAMSACLIIGILLQEFTLKNLHVQLKSVPGFLRNGISKVKSDMLNQPRLVTVWQVSSA
ncbi:MAG: hypothetical protein A2X45_03910 [Lentisphaerae bacterium GWF2_50_93]|nr:MAG: hypothetical protein A2X45_03910 [Lentisphaerae bacterium GWF2_50_93]